MKCSLLVAWQDPFSRLILPVGRLTRADGLFTFEYILAAIDAWDQRGFRGIFDFPGLSARYQSPRLFPVFQNRLMPTARPDYPEFIRTLGLDPANVDPMGVLSRSGGVRATDRIELFAAPAYDPAQGVWIGHFLLRGVRHRTDSEQQRVLELLQGDELTLRAGPDNSQNPEALKICTDDGTYIGYLPDYLLGEVAALRGSTGALRVVVERLNPPPVASQQRLLCRLVAGWNPDHRPFSGPKYGSLVDHPQALERAP
jgi:hypothetical protein